jgi:hypothetical protein
LEGHFYANFFGKKTSWINEVVFGKEPLIHDVLLVINESIISHLQFTLHIKDLQEPKASLQPLLYLSTKFLGTTHIENPNMLNYFKCPRYRG